MNQAAVRCSRASVPFKLSWPFGRGQGPRRAVPAAHFTPPASGPMTRPVARTPTGRWARSRPQPPRCDCGPVLMGAPTYEVLNTNYMVWYDYAVLLII